VVRTRSTPVGDGTWSSGAYSAGGVASASPCRRSLPTTPTIVRGVPQNETCAPIGSRPAKNRSAAAALITTTGSSSGPSASVMPRPPENRHIHGVEVAGRHLSDADLRPVRGLRLAADDEEGVRERGIERMRFGDRGRLHTGQRAD